MVGYDEMVAVESEPVDPVGAIVEVGPHGTSRPIEHENSQLLRGEVNGIVPDRHVDCGGRMGPQQLFFRSGDSVLERAEAGDGHEQNVVLQVNRGRGLWKEESQARDEIHGRDADNFHPGGSGDDRGAIRRQQCSLGGFRVDSANGTLRAPAP